MLSSYDMIKLKALYSKLSSISTRCIARSFSKNDKPKEEKKEEKKEKPKEKKKDSCNDECKKKPKKPKLLKQVVPVLEETMKLFLISSRPLLTQEEFMQSCKIAQEFLCPNGEGAKLQAGICKRAEEKTNWLTEWWLNAAYLENRAALPINSSPCMVYPSVKFKCKEEKINYIARMIRGALEMKQIIDKGKLPQEKRGKYNLDMSQYGKVFGTCRIPGCKKDSLQFHCDSEHIVVIYKNNFFRMPVFDKCGIDMLNEDQITCQLNLIMQMDTPGDPVGILTTDNRDNWGRGFEVLMKEDHNKKVFEIIETSLFIMCIDGPMPKGDSLNQRSIAAKQLLHGGGSKYNSGNRWMDKTIQFVVGEEGQNGMIYEHAPCEGGPVATISDYVIAYIQKNVKAKPCCHYDKACHIVFSIGSDVQALISTAKTNLDCAVQGIQVHGCQFKQFGTDFIKKNNLSPDAFVQSAFQLAFYRIHNKPGATYESAALRIFEDARTENIRGCSAESVKMARTLLNRRSCLEDQMKVLTESIKAHRAFTLKALQGLGCDRHLFGLKMMAKEMDMVTPRIFSDAAFVKSTHWRLSTSQVSTKSDCFMIYGPAVKNGYGCCYNLRAINMNFGITSYSSYPNTVPEKFRVALEESLNEMYDICCKFAKKHPPKKEEPKKPEPKKPEPKKPEPKACESKKSEPSDSKKSETKKCESKDTKKEEKK